MGEQNQHGSGEPAAPKEKEPEIKISASDVRSHPLFLEVTGKLQKRLDAYEAEDNARKTKAAEEKADYEKAIETRIESAKKEARLQWDAEQKVRDAKTAAKLELIKAGFKNERFLRGALEDFDHEKQTAEEFAKAMTEDEGNKAFISSSSTQLKNPDPHPTPRGGNGLLTPAEIQSLRASDKPEDVARANAAAKALWIANNGSTGLPT